MKKNVKIQSMQPVDHHTGGVSIDPQDLRQVEHIQLSEKNGKVLQIGQVCTFIFNFSSLLFLQLDESFLFISGQTHLEMLDNSVLFFFNSVALREHLIPLERLFKKSVQFMKKSRQPYPVMNLEFNIGLDRNKSKRIVFQYSLFQGSNNSSAPVAYGKIVDISHLTNDGPPRLRILQNNQVVHSAEATREEMLRSSGINLNKKDLSVLTFQSKGLRVRDIAQKLKTSELSIYTVIRDMKRKTKMQTVPLMQMLRKKGLLE